MSEYLSSTGSVAAHFEYDPFGNTTVDTDTVGKFDIRFSSKKQDSETGLYYYGYRYYDPVTGRWPSRDPIGEEGGMNLYGMVGNDAVNLWDYLGLAIKTEPAKGYVGWEGTSKCDCPIKAKVTKANFRFDDRTQKADLDFAFTFSLPEPKKCKCLKIRVIQFSGRFKTNGDPRRPANQERNQRTNREGWRVDWPSGGNLQINKLPFLDNAGGGVPWTPNQNGTVKDPPRLLAQATHQFYTCFVGFKEDGSKVWLGCLHWGATRKGTRKPKFSTNPEKPTWTCKTPEELKTKGAIDLWNKQKPEQKVEIGNAK